MRRSVDWQNVVLTLQEDRLSDDGSPGQLHKVKLVNFMCHEHFEMDFWYGCYQHRLYPLHACNDCLLHGLCCVTQSYSCRAFTVSAAISQLKHDPCHAKCSCFELAGPHHATHLQHALCLGALSSPAIAHALLQYFLTCTICTL